MPEGFTYFFYVCRRERCHGEERDRGMRNLIDDPINQRYDPAMKQG